MPFRCVVSNASINCYEAHFSECDKMMSCYLEISLRPPETNLRPLAEMPYVAYVT